MGVRVLLLISLLMPTLAAAQESPPPAPSAEKPDQAPAPPVPATDPGFTPSEKIQADSAVSFPVDI